MKKAKLTKKDISCAEGIVSNGGVTTPKVRVPEDGILVSTPIPNDGRLVVLHPSHKANEWVVHMFNPRNGEYSDGAYCMEPTEAIKRFCSRCGLRGVNPNLNWRSK